MIFQIIGDIAITIGTTTFKPELLDQSKQPVVFNSSWALRTFKPCVKATAVNAEDMTHNIHAVFIEPGFYERVLRPPEQ